MLEIGRNPTESDTTTRGLARRTVARPPRTTRGPRVRRDYMLLHLVAGDVRIEVEGQERRVRAGEVALLLPGRRELLRFAPDADSPHDWVAIQRPPLDPAQLDALEWAPPALPCSRAMAHLIAAAVALGSAPSHRSAPQPAVLVRVATAALALYVEEARARGALVQLASTHPAVQAAREVIRWRLHEPLALADLATAAHLSPDHLIRVFRRELRTTPMRFLWDERVRMATTLLERTRMPVAEVAARTGFRSADHFSRLIRRRRGLPPRDLRRAARHDR